MSCTTERSSPINRLNKVDLPTFGRPTIATPGTPFDSASSLSPISPSMSCCSSGSISMTRSSRSPVFRLWRAETPMGSPKPKDTNSQISGSRRGVSILFTARTTRVFDRRRIDAILVSSSVIPVVPSTTRTIKSESPIAFSLWADTLSSSSLPEGIQPPVSTS